MLTHTCFGMSPFWSYWLIRNMTVSICRQFILLSACFATSLIAIFWSSCVVVCRCFSLLTHWGRVTQICVSKLTIIGPDNGLSPGRRQAIDWTNAGILLIGPLVTNFSEILIEIHTFLFKKMHLRMSSGKWRPFCPGLNVLNIENAYRYVWVATFTILWCVC